MEFLLDQNTIERYLQAELDSEDLDKFVNEVFLQKVDADQLRLLLNQYDPKDAYRKYFLTKMDEEDKTFFPNVAIGFGLDEIKETPLDEITSNPYYQYLSSIEPFKHKNIEFSSLMLEPYQLFLSEDKGHDDLLITQEKTLLSFVKEKISIPCLKQDGYVWMSLVPHEIHTMKKAIEEATGDVLVYGIGLGYYAYMVSLKKDVKSVTIIEKDPQILAIFKKYFLDGFMHKDKIKLMEGDALQYQKDCKTHFDYCFVDIYHGEVDGFPLYANLLSNEGIADKSSYWIEESLLTYFRRHVVLLMEELYFNGYTEADYQSEDDQTSMLLKKLYLATKDLVIHNEEELAYLFSNQRLKQLIKQLGY